MALPPNWARYQTEDGREYFHNALTNTTQWDRPTAPVATDPFASLSFDSGPSDVFQYNPTASDLSQASVARSPGPESIGFHEADLGLSPKKDGGGDQELVSLVQPAPTGQMGSSASSSGPTSSAGGVGGFAAGFAAGMAAAGGGGAGAEGGGGLSGWVLSYAQQLFDVSTDDVVQRLRLVLQPYPLGRGEATSTELKARPDLYGPFWVATTAVLFLAATGNFARLLEAGTHKNFKADYSLVSIAAAMIYGGLLAVPVIVRSSLFVSGEEVASVNFRQLVCICGYALAPAIPVSILCVVPLGFLRWLLVFAGLGMGIFFLYGHLLAEVQVRTSWLKYTMIVAPCGAQAIVFLVYRLYFFTAQASPTTAAP